jgi:hypothetical protein
MENLERLLLELNDSAGVGASDPGNIVDNIEAFVLSDTTSADRELSLNLLLTSESPPSLLTWVNASLRTKDKILVKAKISALKFIYRYLKLAGFYFERFAVLTFNSLLDAFRREDSGEVRAALLLPIKIILKYCQQFGYSESLGYPEMVEARTNVLNPENISLAGVYRYLLEDLKHNKKTSTKTVKSELFKVLGLLVNAYPQDDSTTIQVVPIVEYSLWSLDQNFSCGKDVEPSVIAGIFSCLDRIAYCYEGTIFSSTKAKTSVFEFLLKAVSAVKQGDISRFAMSSKALRFLENHSSLFEGLISKNARQTYLLALECYQTKKEGISKHSEGAVLKIVSEISNSISDSVSQLAKSADDATALQSVIGSEAGQAFSQLLGESLSYINDAVDVHTLVASETSFYAKSIAMISPAVAHLERIGYVHEKFGEVAMNIVQTAAASVNPSRITSESSYSEMPASWSIKHVHLFGAVVHLVNESVESTEVPRVILDWLLETMVEALSGYNKLIKKYQSMLTKAFLFLGQAAQKSFTTEYLEAFVPTLFLKSVSRGNVGTYSNYSFLSSMSYEDELVPDDVLDVNVILKPLVNDYIPLWKEMLIPTDNGVLFQFMKKQFDYKRLVGNAIFHHFYIVLTKCLRTLDMQYTSSGMDSVLPANPVDQGWSITVYPNNFGYSSVVQTCSLILPLWLTRLSWTATMILRFAGFR